MTIRRRSQIAKRFSKIRGVSASEKSMLLRIGEVVDGAINNRTPANPFETNTRTKLDPRLPPPSVINVKDGVRSIQLSWPAVNSSILLYYKVSILSIDNDEEVLNKVTSTPSFIYKGGAGKYRALIHSVGRNGTASRATGVEFTIPSTVMIMEGSKNGVQTISPIVNETVLTPEDYNVFVWASFTLNNFANPASNSQAVAQLLMGDDIDTAVVLQTISLFGESETFTNMDDNTGAGISRPNNPTRSIGELFQTSQSLRFAVEDVTDAMAGNLNTFWVRITGRQTSDNTNENDVASLSIVVWVASTGREVVLPDVPAVLKSVDTGHYQKGNGAGQGNGFTTNIDSPITGSDGTIANLWTTNIWVKPAYLDLTDTSESFQILTSFSSASSYSSVFSGNHFPHNSRALFFHKTNDADDDFAGGSYPAEPRIRLGAFATRSRGSNPGSPGIPPGGGGGQVGPSIAVYDNGDGFGTRTYISDDTTDFFPDGIKKWHMVTAVWAGDNVTHGNQKMFLYVNGQPVNESLVDITDDETTTVVQVAQDTKIGGAELANIYGSAMCYVGASNGSDLVGSSATDTISKGLYVAGSVAINDTLNNESISPKVSSCGWWNVALTASEVLALYNNGVDFNWKSNSGAYQSASSIQHYWQMANLEGKETIVDSGLNAVTASDLIKDENLPEGIIYPISFVPFIQGVSEGIHLDEDVPGDEDN